MLGERFMDFSMAICLFKHRGEVSSEKRDPWLVRVDRGFDILPSYMGVSKNSGTQQPLVFLLNMIILGCFGGTTILGNPHIGIVTTHYKDPY